MRFGQANAVEALEVNSVCKDLKDIAFHHGITHMQDVLILQEEQLGVEILVVHRHFVDGIVIFDDRHSRTEVEEHGVDIVVVDG